MRQGITTMYKGIEYRSRLEAKWAAFFGIIGWEFTYEPFDGNGYIPDFLIHGEHPVIVEVKPAVTPDDYKQETAKIDRGLTGVWDKRVLIVGVTPLLPWGDYQPQPNMGLITDGDYICHGDEFNIWNWSCVSLCGPQAHKKDNQHAGTIHMAVCDEYMSFVQSPCGQYDGNNTWGNENTVNGLMNIAWASATNEVKWRGKDAS